MKKNERDYYEKHSGPTKPNPILKVQGKDSTTLWVAGQIINFAQRIWEFQGVFNSEERAIAACKNQYYFVAPIPLNQEIPEETKSWEGMYYPLWNDDSVNER